MSNLQGLLFKAVAAVLAVAGLLTFVEAFDASGFFGVLGRMVLGVFLFWTAVGFWRMRGWAFLVWSVILLGAFFYTQVELILAIDRGAEQWKWAGLFVLDIVLIGYFGRWAVERRFRPHLDVDTGHHHHDDAHEPAAT